MSKTMVQERQELEETVQYMEAEVASLDEELTLFRKEHPPLPKRAAFVELRIGRLNKDLVELKQKVVDLTEHERWLVRMKQGRV